MESARKWLSNRSAMSHTCAHRRARAVMKGTTGEPKSDWPRQIIIRNHVEAAIRNCYVFIKEEPRGFRYDHRKWRQTRVKDFWGEGFIVIGKNWVYLLFRKPSTIPTESRTLEGEMRARGASVCAPLSHRSLSPWRYWVRSDGQICTRSACVCVRACVWNGDLFFYNLSETAHTFEILIGNASACLPQ